MYDFTLTYRRKDGVRIIIMWTSLIYNVICRPRYVAIYKGCICILKLMYMNAHLFYATLLSICVISLKN